MPQMTVKAQMDWSSLQKLPAVLRDKVMAKAIRRPGPVISKILRAVMPQSHGRAAAYRRAHGHPAMNTLVVSQVTKVLRAGNLMLTLKVGAKYPDAAQAHLVDKGTANRTTKKGQNRGAIHGVDFVERAWATAQTQAELALMEGLAAGAQSEIRKLEKSR